MPEGAGEPVLPTTDRLPESQKLAYSGLLVPVAILHAPALSVLPALYAKHSGIAIATIGLALMAVRVLDAVTDPLIGYFSDRTTTSYGRRKPWILAGALVCSLAVYFQFRPGPTTGAFYFFTWSLVLYVGWTLVEIPHSAWLSDLTRDYDEKTRLAGFRVAAGFVGDIIFRMSPLLPLFATTEMTPEVTAFVSWFVIAMLIPLTLLALWKVRQGQPFTGERPRVGETLQALTGNKPFQIYFAMTLATNLSSGMVGGLYFFFLDAHLGILERFAHVGLTVAVIGLISTFVWPRIIERMEKHYALVLTNSAVVATLVAMGFIQPGPYAFPLLLAVFGISSFFAAGAIIVLTSMLADIVDYDTKSTGKNRAGNYYALLAFAQKFGVALGGGLGLFVAGMFGFDAQGDNDARAMTGFYLMFLGVPIMLNATAATLAWRFPLGRAEHARILRELAGEANAGRLPGQAG